MSQMEQLKEAAEAVLKNAIQLYEEAQLLGANGHHARAVCLHQISNEECSNVNMLGSRAMSVVLG